MKDLNYRVDAIKKKLRLKESDKIQPGDLINKAKKMSTKPITKSKLTKKDVAIRGLV